MTILTTPESILDVLASIAKEGGDGQFIVRVSARRAGIMVPTLLAAFRDGTLEHIVNGEGWVAKLVGGGEYHLTVSHPSAPAKRYGPIAINIPGAPFQTVNVAAIGASDWTGPQSLSYPEPASAMPVAPIPAFPSFGFQGGAQYATSRPNNVPVSGAGAQVISQLPPQDAEKLMLLQREENRIRGELSAKEAELSQRVMEAKLARDAAERDDKLRKEMQLTLAQRPEKTGPSAIEIVSAISASVAPILAAMIQSSQAGREASAQQQQRQMEAQLAAQERQSNMMTTILLKMGERPGTSPEMTAMIEMSKFQAEAQGSMMSRIVEAMGVVSKTSVAMIETVAEFSAPPEGSPVLDAVREGTKALMALSKGAEAGARGSIAARPASLPAAAAAANNQRQQVAQRAAQVEHQAQVAAAAAARARTQVSPSVSPATPTEVVQFNQTAPAPAPNMPPARELLGLREIPKPKLVQDSPAPAAAFDGLDGLPDGFGNIDSSVEKLEAMIRLYHDPREVAAYFLDSLGTHEMRMALDRDTVKGDPSALVAELLGVWCLDPANTSYLSDLGDAVQEIGAERGLLEDDNGDPYEPAKPEPAPAP